MEGLHWKIYANDLIKPEYRGDGSIIIVLPRDFREAGIVINSSYNGEVVKGRFQRLIDNRESGFIYNGVNLIGTMVILDLVRNGTDCRMIGWEEKRKTLMDSLEEKLLRSYNQQELI